MWPGYPIRGHYQNFDFFDFKIRKVEHRNNRHVEIDFTPEPNT